MDRLELGVRQSGLDEQRVILAVDVFEEVVEQVLDLIGRRGHERRVAGVGGAAADPVLLGPHLATDLRHLGSLHQRPVDREEVIELEPLGLRCQVDRRLHRSNVAQHLHGDLVAHIAAGRLKSIQERSGRRLICYVSGIKCSIDRDDTVPFVDLLHNVHPGEDLDLLLHTGGGDIDAAEKLISMVRNKVGTATLRIVVPDYAKSAGTLMVLGADFVVMSDTSELGPIDPQIVLSDGDGNRILHPIQSYLDAYDEHSKTLKNEPGNVAAQIMLGKLDPATVKLFQAVKVRAQRFAEAQLVRGMFRDGGNWSLAASELLDTKRWLSHGQMISWEDAAAPPIGLHVEYLDPMCDNWQEYWQLYCLQRLAVGDRQKLYESDYASLIIDGPA